MLKKNKNIWPLSLNGKVPNCQLGIYQFKSGRGRENNNNINWCFSLLQRQSKQPFLTLLTKNNN